MSTEKKAAFSTLTCPACGSIEPLLIKDPVVFGCKACAQVHKVDASGNLRPREKDLVYRIENVRPNWMLPGAKIRYNNSEFTLHTVMNFSTHWNEYESEEGWTSGFLNNLEYYFVSKSGKELCITEDEGRFYIRIPSKTFDADLPLLNGNGQQTGVVEYGNFQLNAFVGQDDEPLDRSSWDYRIVSNNGDLEYEWNPANKAETLRCFYFQPIRLTELERMRVRDKNDMLEAQVKAKDLAFYRNLFGYSALLLILLMLYSGIATNTLSKETWTFSVPTVQELNEQNDSSFTGPLQHSLGVFQVSQGKSYTFGLECTFYGSNADAEFSIQLVRQSDGRPVNTFKAYFYTESGVDSDGSWTESTLRDNFKFKAEESGKYEIYASVLPDDMTTSRNGILVAEVRRNVLTRYFLVLGAIFTLAWLIYQWQWEYTAIAGGDSKVSAWLRSIFGL
jgi:hypothetical protein